MVRMANEHTSVACKIYTLLSDEASGPGNLYTVTDPFQIVHTSGPDWGQPVIRDNSFWYTKSRSNVVAGKRN